MPIRHNYQATGVNDGAKQVSVDRWNDGHVIDSEVGLPVLATDPAAPADGFLTLYGKKIGGRTMLSQMGPSGLDTALQPNLGGNKVALWMPPGNSTAAPGLFGMSALAVTGTAAARIVATTNMLTRMTRLAYVSAATAAAFAGVREAAAKYTTGAGAGLGGFFARYRFATSDPSNVNGARMFVGLSASIGAPTNVEPSTLVNVIGVAQLSTSANLQIVHGSTVAQAPIDLGANFPANRASQDVYELTLFSPTAGGCYYEVTRLNTGAKASGFLAAPVCPAGTTLLCHQLWRTNNATAVAVGLDICGIYIETDY